MVSALACLQSTPFKAFAPVIYKYYNPKECDTDGPRPTLSFQGDKDFVVPIESYGDPVLIQKAKTSCEDGLITINVTTHNQENMLARK